MVKTHRINIKGYCNKTFFDAQTQRGYADVSYGYGAIFFKGTDSELDEYLDFLVENEGKFNFKII